MKGRSANEQYNGMKTSDVLGIVLVSGVLGYGAYDGFLRKQNSEIAAAAGFDSSNEYNAAMAAGFSDVVKWRAERERLAAARLEAQKEYERSLSSR